MKTQRRNMTQVQTGKLNMDKLFCGEEDEGAGKPQTAKVGKLNRFWAFQPNSFFPSQLNYVITFFAPWRNPSLELQVVTCWVIFGGWINMKRAAVNLLISSKFQGGGRSVHRGGRGSTSHHQADHANRFQTTKNFYKRTQTGAFQENSTQKTCLTMDQKTKRTRPVDEVPWW